MAQTSVEWFAEMVSKMGYVSSIIVEQAKEMHKQEIIDAYKRESLYMYHAGCSDEQINRSADKYYKETFKKD